MPKVVFEEPGTEGAAENCGVTASGSPSSALPLRDACPLVNPVFDEVTVTVAVASGCRPVTLTNPVPLIVAVPEVVLTVQLKLES